jgi:hypothetical protein
MSDVFPSDRLWELEDLYRGSFETPPLAYGTVRDLADSLDNLAGLARANGDMKDLQRCWVLKAVLGRIERGARLVEIGAGDPLVADLLTRLGHPVTIVDPYDGSDQGPREFERFQSEHPDIEFIRERFPPSAPLPDDVACVYSISVLEHVPAEQIGAVMAAAAELTGPGGCSIHAIDHVVAGWGAEAHRARLEETVRRAGLDVAALGTLLEELARDPDAYFVSAEAHERWRGALPYDEYPMRRICSIGLVSGPES